MAKKPLLRKPLRKGQIVFHGTSARDEFEDLHGPAWVSDSIAVAREFLAWNGAEGDARIQHYRITTAPALVVVHTDRDMRAFTDWLGEKTGEDFDRGGIQEVAEAVCRVRGIDGWHIPNNYPSGSDTMLCDPLSHLELVKVEVVETRARRGAAVGGVARKPSVKPTVVTAYHGGPVPIQRFDPSHSAMAGIFWFSEDRDAIVRGDKGISAKYLMTAKLKVRKTAGWSEYDRYSIGELRRDGFDSVKLDEDWIIFDKKNIEVVSVEKVIR